MMLILLIVVLLVVLGSGGYWGQGRYGAGAWSPLGIILVIVLVLFLTGRLHL